MKCAGIASAFFVVLIATLTACTTPREGVELRSPERAVFVPMDTLTPVRLPGAAFDDARALASDPLGFLYVADAGRHVVVKLQASGAVETVLGGPGSREGEFDEPSGIEPTNGLILFVADAGNHRIQRFSRAHAYLGSIPLTAAGEVGPSSRVTYRRGDGEAEGTNSGRPTAVATSDAKEIFAIDADRNVVLKWDENLRLAAVIGDVEAGRGALSNPVDLDVGAEGRLYVADRGRREVLVYDAYGSFVRTIGAGRLEQLRAVAASDSTIFAGHDRRLTVFSPEGNFHRAIHLDLPAPIVDLTFSPNGTLYLLTPNHLYTLELQ